MIAEKAHAVTIYSGSYEATSVTTGGNDHTVWLPGLFSGVGAYWQFASGTGDFVVGAGNATAMLDGRIDNNGNSNLQFDLDIDLVLRNPNAPGGGGTKDGGIDGGLTPAERAALKSTWSFYDIQSATLTGVGVLDGLVMTMIGFPQAPGDIPFQLGESANDKNQGLGVSGWFSWRIDSQATNTNYVARPNGSSNSHGDININISAVPLPSAGLLLIGGVGALGAIRARRKKKAA
ncbi:VPLPA-CTERM sorting domain-containing protein [Tateyamaria armeniaca]|uniref:VPLPA-CTERM sorting domain-containing protein n=1 Tax=Tateyamaria armeniaca TaxID=2518930 RepID=A0ABW8UQA1_9RHOB